MSESIHAPNPDSESQHTHSTASTNAPATESTPAALPTAPLTSKTPLPRAPLLTAQRQAFALQIARTQGNRAMQRILNTKDAPTTATSNTTSDGPKDDIKVLKETLEHMPTDTIILLYISELSDQVLKDLKLNTLFTANWLQNQKGQIWLYLWPRMEKMDATDTKPYIDRLSKPAKAPESDTEKRSLLENFSKLRSSKLHGEVNVLISNTFSAFLSAIEATRRDIQKSEIAFPFDVFVELVFSLVAPEITIALKITGELTKSLVNIAFSTLKGKVKDALTNNSGAASKQGFMDYLADYQKILCDQLARDMQQATEPQLEEFISETRGKTPSYLKGKIKAILKQVFPIGERKHTVVPPNPTSTDWHRSDEDTGLVRTFAESSDGVATFYDQRYALVKLHTPIEPPAPQTWEFICFVDKDLEDMAMARAKATQRNGIPFVALNLMQNAPKNPKMKPNGAAAEIIGSPGFNGM